MGEELCMAKRGKPDTLSLWAAAAKAAGMSYGQYVASVPLEDRPGYQKQEDIMVSFSVPEPDGYLFCPVCGRHFPVDYRKPNKKYCCSACQTTANRIRNRDLKRRRRAQAAAAAKME